MSKEEVSKESKQDKAVTQKAEKEGKASLQSEKDTPTTNEPRQRKKN